MGIPWNFNGKDIRERWGGDAPVIISPKNWDKLQAVIERMQELHRERRLKIEPPEDEFDLPSPPETPLEAEEEYSPPQESTPQEDTSPRQQPSESIDSLDFAEVSPFLL